ncbi:MAG: hypothetical protein B7Y88_11390 [Sphingomonadales bacterium 32-64-17]|nr:MAG: hypothetical protein B7Y88_11390 [Sphingomonadales bacterium 32-64-17]
MQMLADRLRASPRGLVGTWVKFPSLESMQLLAHAGFEFVVIDLEHAPHAMDRAVELVFAAQAMGMAALVRLPDQTGAAVQPLLDGGADGLLVPRVTSPEIAAAIARRMVFAPHGERGLGTTSRAGRWGTGDMAAYIERGNEQCLRVIQLEDWDNIARAADYAALDDVNGLFIGHGDLLLSSGKGPGDPDVRQLTARMLAACQSAGVFSGVAAAAPELARNYLDMGFSLVMVSNDTTMFAQAAAETLRRTLG